ncbi:outer membrane beta-barrel protein [Rufibacter latericius]|uniref:Outer membrane protein beta-barrel domain-containing protein n=1 Tax=Rufibacter latericius TaxID=2487040 RepID=A0A3M9ML17_9BACT|nr:outer membrane beta-barrel protein [Rufibacter latericius]RNI26171.1 hypothetical protein EFB08_15250 [Rufibacter latericius]
MKKSPAEKEQGQSVEDIFRKGFAEAESAPPPRIWENVNLELENHDLQRYRRQVVVYRSIAAAFLLLLISAGIVLWQQDGSLVEQPGNTLATSQEKVGDVSSDVFRPEDSETKVVQIESEPPGQVASVSKPFSGKAPQSSRVAVARSTRKETAGPVSPQQTKAPFEIKAQQSVNSPVSPEIQAASPSRGNASPENVSQPEKGAAEANSRFAQSGADKPFPRSLINTLSFSKALPAAIDSSKAAPEKTILALKETVNNTSAEAQPVSKGNEAEEGDVYKWSVTMAYSPQYAYAPVKIGNNPSMDNAAIGQSQVYQEYRQAVEEYNESYTPTYSYSALVGASYRFNDKWQLETGILYTQNEATTTQSYVVYQGGYAQAYIPGNVGNSFTGNSGKSAPLVASALDRAAAVQPVFVNRTDRYNTRYRYQQVGLPVRLAYRLNFNKVYALFSGGVNMNLLVQNSIVPETDQVQAVTFGLNDKDSPYHALQWATTTSIGVGYDVTRKMSILIAPEFTYSLTPMVRDQQQENAYQLGVSIGGRWRLTK